MLPVFNFLLRGIGSSVRLGKSGPIIKATQTGIEVRNPIDSDLTNLKVASPISPQDAVNLSWVKSEVLTNWNSPVQNLSELKSVPANERKDKQMREVEDELTLYQFDADSYATVPDVVDPLRVILPNDLTLVSPGRWIKTKARTSLHSELIGLTLNDHPQYQLRGEKNSSLGYPGLGSDFGLELLSSGGIKSILRSLSTAIREFLLPDRSGTLALDTTFQGSTFSVNGEKGLVPAPLTTDREKFLSGDGSWKTNFGSLKNTGVKTSSYTASKYERVLCDVTSGSFNVTLPVNPSDNEVVGILDISNKAGTNPITIERNGQKIEDISEDWQLDLDGVSIEICFSSEKGSWYFLTSKSYSNVAPSNGFLTNTPMFTETSLAPSANAVRQYVEQIQASILQLASSFGAFLFGSSSAPPGTIIKNAYFEGTTNSNGLCTIQTGLSNVILSVSAFISDNLGKWFSLPPSGIVATLYFDESGIVSVQFTGNSTFQNRNVRFRVEFK
ncbi:hypothetical protein LEP1GSC005_1325 [Leptospira santarosai str. ST188]|uniref:hypothetical protein n=1 Tax=Leptospira santarosai TaxID=28183 RepID=UPI0002BBA838|nr:hypothetical protein [Leptospira santarosai]EMF91198.1 hypothetical protein LEP1GSC005_1325 [Leptospira santarosai str. ST188]